ncbi:hypothetical protein B6S59_02870 [Pseudomonas sp. A46]|nr:hypothetical protein B6S59_02870 [Pseudomonas sp. A46]
MRASARCCRPESLIGQAVPAVSACLCRAPCERQRRRWGFPEWGGVDGFRFALPILRRLRVPVQSVARMESGSGSGGFPERGGADGFRFALPILRRLRVRVQSVARMESGSGSGGFPEWGGADGFRFAQPIQLRRLRVRVQSVARMESGSGGGGFPERGGADGFRFALPHPAAPAVAGAVGSPDGIRERRWGFPEWGGADGFRFALPILRRLRVPEQSVARMESGSGGGGLPGVGWG